MSEMPETWKRTESHRVADCRVFSVREDRSVNGDKSGTFYVIENPDWVNVIALTKERNVVLIEQFRHGVEQITLEIPGGMVDGDEDPETAARRELLEETGYSSERWIHLGSSLPNPALQSNVIHHFLAVDAEKTADVSFDDHESVVTSLVHIDEVPTLIREGRLRHSLVIAAFQFLTFQSPKNF